VASVKAAEVPEPPLDLLRVRPTLEQHGRAGVAERVKACPLDPVLLGGWREHSAPKVGGAERRARQAREDEIIVGGPFARRAAPTKLRDELGVERNLAPTVLRLRRLNATADDCAPDIDVGPRTVEREVAPLECDRLRDSDARGCQHAE
jgi:hypothetical protein